jgi:cytochrome d ubiquinol oxidase subunit II
MGIEYVSVWVMVGALLVYALFGGADYGAGVWDLLASGPRRKAQRELIAHAIGPIWEANHVWLILVVVVMFSCFPRAFAGMMTALHVPVTLVLLGIVARGVSFTFRSYGRGSRVEAARWGVLFSAASVFTPMLLGVTLATAVSGRLEWREGVYASGFFEPWLRVFPWVTGCFVLSIFAFLAAVYLCVEAEGALREDFRRRAIGAGIAVGVLAAATWVMAYRGAPLLSTHLQAHWWAWPLQIGTGAMAVRAFGALWVRRYVLARTCAVGQVVLIVVGFGAAVLPYLVVPGFTLENSAAPARTHELALGAVGGGGGVLVPSLVYLMRVFKGREAFAVVGEGE